LNRMQEKHRILLVEDDPNLGFVVQDNLSLKGYDVRLCRDGDEALSAFAEQTFDLCIFDVMLPRRDGFSLARSVRESNQHIPILFLTAKSMTDDKLEGFATGADDYITKPFSLEELFCRVEVFLKRRQVEKTTGATFQIGLYAFDPENFRLVHPAAEKTLTAREADILKLLIEHRNRILKREEILNAVWGNDDYFLGRSLDVFISKLRKYLKEDPAVQIVNYHGVGFRLEVGTA
jgi:DNA-binding response OmpR family regulator